MNCKKCEAELEEGMNFCPNCGAAQNEPEEVIAEEEALVKTGLGAGKIALLAVLAVAAVAVMVALLLSGRGGKEPAETTAPTGGTESVVATIPADGNPDDVTCKGSYTVSDEDILAAADTVVATMGDAKLTNAELQVYYWMEVFSLFDYWGVYASYYGLDYTKPLDTQISIDGELTWQQLFLSFALENWANYQTMTMAADEAGFELSEYNAGIIEEERNNLTESAANAGYASVDDLIQMDFGPCTTLEDYLRYLRTNLTGNEFYMEIAESFQFTDAEVEAYYDEHAAEYQAEGIEKKDEFSADVRHILISPEGGTTGEDGTTTYTDEAWAAAEKKANEILNEWLSGEKTEDNFASLAQDHSEDPGSASNGGLYKDVLEGKMVEPFDNWCFDESRLYGDYGIVKTEFGYHIMYFVDSGLRWYRTAEDSMQMEKADEHFQPVLDAHPVEIDYSAIKLAYVDLAGTE